ncbi:MAG: aminotransferase class I/II-fold pyridoxal phosphate-dependent enzyme [Kiritimatiellae bacterium]|nr:aminotransferase class I/II-fold pyridoxal phosphate-dependent enzyme [Kiritimatiellia bacterium]
MSGPVHELAEKLNGVLQADGSPLFRFLSAKGQRAFFPSTGILGQGAQAKGAAINATIGTAFEEDGTPLSLECAERLTALPSTAFLYSPSSGVAALRDVWREMLFEKNPSLKGKRFSHPVVTHALTHGLFVAGHLFVGEDDALILPNLYWDNYELLFCEGYGARLDLFPMFTAAGAFNAAAMEAKLMESGERKILLLNFPNNPTGYTATESDAVAITASIRRAAEAGKKVVVILDDAYFGLVYEEGVCRESLFVHLADLHPNVLAVKLDGATKEDYVWGVRVGFITFASQGATDEQYRALEAKAAGTVRGTVSNCSNIGQQMMLKIYRDPDYVTQKREKYAILNRRYQTIKRELAAHPEYAESFTRMPSNSGYFMCVKPIGVDAESVRRCLIERFSTGVIVLNGLIRLAFSSVPNAALPTLFANIDAAVRYLKERA